MLHKNHSASKDMIKDIDMEKNPFGSRLPEPYTRTKTITEGPNTVYDYSQTVTETEEEESQINCSRIGVTDFSNFNKGLLRKEMKTPKAS